MNALMRRWYGDMLDTSPDLVETMPDYKASYRSWVKPVKFFRFGSGRPGGWWGIRRSIGHRAFGINFHGAFGRLGYEFCVWPLWAVHFHGFLFPSRDFESPEGVEEANET